MTAEPSIHVVPARSLPINDKTLHHLRNVAHDARRGETTPAEAEFLLATVGPLLDELIAWRNFAAGVVPAEAIVAYLPGGRG
jgi:hypothetical protein